MTLHMHVCKYQESAITSRQHTGLSNQQEVQSELTLTWHTFYKMIIHTNVQCINHMYSVKRVRMRAKRIVFQLLAPLLVALEVGQLLLHYRKDPSSWSGGLFGYAGELKLKWQCLATVSFHPFLGHHCCKSHDHVPEDIA